MYIQQQQQTEMSICICVYSTHAHAVYHKKSWCALKLMCVRFQGQNTYAPKQSKPNLRNSELSTHFVRLVFAVSYDECYRSSGSFFTYPPVFWFVLFVVFFILSPFLRLSLALSLPLCMSPIYKIIRTHPQLLINPPLIRVCVGISRRILSFSILIRIIINFMPILLAFIACDFILPVVHVCVCVCARVCFYVFSSLYPIAFELKRWPLANKLI